MNKIEMFHHERTVVTETVGFRFEEDLFISVQIIIGFGYHAQHWNGSPNINGCCRTLWFQVRSRPFKISTDYHTRLLSCTTLKRFTTRKWLLHKALVSYSKRIFQISTDDHELLFSWTTLRHFIIRIWLLQKPLVSDSEPSSSNQYRLS